MQGLYWDALANPNADRRIIALATVAGLNYVGARTIGVLPGIAAVNVVLNAAAILDVLGNHATADHYRERIARYNLAPSFRRWGSHFNVAPSLLAGIAVKESSINPGAVGPAPYFAVGLMQVLPAEASRFGDLRDTDTNIRAGAAILREKYNARGSTVGALKAYGGFVKADASEYLATVLGYATAFALGGME